ncbi:hypothetical protein F5Y08DRAFT_23455 [Xylaria arbuscula]|uniref:Uncharacterized protein n=1 Tax=Xylaria arbuscula TaxID=114810 RepID=A0A9W8N4U2_9PEZI|nr:hypothetical protein F5Y08DRAFT_23455 [Xylaria arbuscula]KAJ3555096.1 hypothetical protein NPX13_g10432 [Xylaria arbuscula]
MYFAKSLSSFVVSALLATTALGSAIPVPRQPAVDIAARDEIKAARDESIADMIRKRADQCLSEMKRRRTAMDVSIGQVKFGINDDTIDTVGLATCFGIAVVGTWADGTSGEFDRAMSHTYADYADDNTVIEAFQELVQTVVTAKDGGLSIERVVMVAPDPASYNDGQWSQEEIDQYNEEYAAYVGTITQNFGVAPEEKTHDYKESWRLSIKSDKTIECGPEGGDNKC